jgi:hypothetical protein
MHNKTSFIDLSKTTKSIILFGSGDIATKTISKLPKNRIDFIVDNSTNLQGTRFKNYNIKDPGFIKDKHFVIICSTAILDISNQLEGMGLVGGIDYAVSPILNDLTAISELEGLKKTIYFTSGTVAKDEYGGGLYKCNVDGSEVSVERLYSGPCYGMVEREGEILFIDTDNGIFLYDNKSVVKVGVLPSGSRAHGISYNETNKKYYITCSYLDAILEMNSNFSITNTFYLSDKIKATNEPMHHCNDNIAIGNSLYVSMFSSTGNWKKDCFDGCIAEFDIESGTRLGDVCSGLYMPHNVKSINGSLHVLDSLPGHLRYGNLSIQGTFPGFTRGLAFSRGFYYIGQSKNRNYSRVLGVSNNISIDCGIVVFDPNMNTSRFLQFPPKIGEIHSISVV